MHRFIVPILLMDYFADLKHLAMGFASPFEEPFLFLGRFSIRNAKLLVIPL